MLSNYFLLEENKKMSHQKISQHNFFSVMYGHVHKYEASLWTLENWEKYLFCYKMIIFNVTVLKISENMYIIDI